MSHAKVERDSQLGRQKSVRLRETQTDAAQRAAWRGSAAQGDQKRLKDESHGECDPSIYKKTFFFFPQPSKTFCLLD